MNSAERRMDRWYSSFRAAEPWGPTRLVHIRRCTKQGSSSIGLSVPRLVLLTPASSQAMSLRIASPNSTNSGRGCAPTHGHSYRLGQDFPRLGRTGRHLSVVSLHFLHPICRHSGAHKSPWAQVALYSIRPRRSAKHSLSYGTARSSINGHRG